LATRYAPAKIRIQHLVGSLAYERAIADALDAREGLANHCKARSGQQERKGCSQHQAWKDRSRCRGRFR